MKQRKSVNLKETVKKVKSAPRDHHKTRYFQTSLALLATDNLEPRLAEAATKEHTIKHEHIQFRIKKVFLNTERQRINSGQDLVNT